MNKRWVPLVLTMAMVLSCVVPGRAFAQPGDTLEVGTRSALISFAAAVNGGDSYAGKTVRLTANIADVGDWTGINGFAGTFDGGGHTISGLSLSTVTEDGTGFFNTTMGGAVIRDLTIADSSFTGAVRVGALVGKVTGALTVDNVRVKNDVAVKAAARLGGLIGSAEGNVTAQNCWSAAALTVAAVGPQATVGYAGGLIGWVHSGVSAAIKGCLFSGGLNFTGGDYCGGMVGHIHGSAGSVGTVTITSSVSLPGSFANAAAHNGGFVGGSQSPSYVTVAVTNSYTGKTSAAGTGLSLQSGASYWTPGTTENGTTRFIAFPAQLMGFALASKTHNFSGRTLQLESDIDLSGLGEWPMFGKSNNAFDGDFNGNGHTVSGCRVATNGSVTTSDTYPIGFVTQLGGTLRSLTITNSSFSSDTHFAGGAVGRMMSGSNIANVHVTSSVRVEGYHQVGGVVGKLNGSSTVIGCWSEAMVRLSNLGATSNACGGVAGSAQFSDNSISNCLFSGTADAGIGASGGIIGSTMGSGDNLGYISVTGCVSAGSLSGAYKGGILGLFAEVGTDNSAGAYDYTQTYSIRDSYAVADRTVGTLTPAFTDNWTSNVVTCNAVSKLYGGFCKVLDGSRWVWREGALPLPAAFRDAGYTAIGTRSDLLAFAAAVNGGDNFAGKTARLTANIADVGDWTGINGFAGTFDGGGHTISGLSLSTVTEDGTGFFNTTAGGAVIRDLTIADSSFTGKYRVGALVGKNAGALVLTNVWVKNDVTVKAAARLGGLIGSAEGNVTAESCWSAATLTVTAIGAQGAVGYAGGLIGWVDSGTAAATTGCLFSGGLNFDGGDYCGGMVGHIHGSAGSVGTVTITSSVSLPGSFANATAHNGGFVGGSQSPSYVTVAVTNSYTGKTSAAGTGLSLQSGASYWTPGTTENGTTRFIAFPAQLMGFALASKTHSFSGRTLQLESDVDLSGLGEWPMLGSESCSFAGTFNGNGHTVSGLTATVNGNAVGFASVVGSNGWIANLTVTDSDFSCTGYWAGAAAGQILSGGKVQSVRVSDTVSVTAPQQVGGIAGTCNGGQILNCLCQAQVTQTNTGAAYWPGGIVGTVRSTGNEISHCLFAGHISGAGSGGYAGGLVGWCADTPAGTAVTIGDCVVTGTYTGVSNYGGVLGYNSGTYTINTCYVAHATKYVGGQNPGNAVGSAYYPSADHLRGTDICTGLNTAAYWIMTEGKLPILKTFASVDIEPVSAFCRRENLSDVPVPVLTGCTDHSEWITLADCCGRSYYYGSTNLLNSVFVPYLSALESAGFTLYKGGTEQSTANVNARSAVFIKGDRLLLVEWRSARDIFRINICVAPASSGKIWNSDALFAGLPDLGNAAEVEDYGRNDYVKTYTGKTQSNYDSLCSSLASDGFTKVADNSNGRFSDRIQTRSYQKGDLTVTVVFSSKKGEIYLSVAKNTVLSPHLNNQAAWAADNTIYDSTVMVVPALINSGNSFVFRLRNGHFLINDGGTTDDTENLVALLEHMSPAGRIPVVDGWFISHSHEDHVGVLDKLISDSSLGSRIRVEGIYYSVPSVRNLSLEATNYGRSVCLTGAMSLRTSTGAATPVYRNHTGERYYFSDVSVDIVMTQEQIPMIEQTSDLNDTCTWICVNVDGQTILLGGDGEDGQKARIMAYYDSGDMTSTMRSLLHHGGNESKEFIDYCRTTTVLGTSVSTKEYSQKAYITANSAEQIYYDEDHWFTFPYTVGSSQTPMDISPYRSNGTYSAPAEVQPADTVFGGWYWDSALTRPVDVNTTEGYAFPRFVDKDVLTVKYQIDENRYAEGNRKLRIVTTVDRMDYKRVGFKVTYYNSIGVLKENIVIDTNKVYALLIGYTYENDEGTPIFYTPDGMDENGNRLFSSDSIRFCAFILNASRGICLRNPAGISATPFWITADGTEVTGTPRSGLTFMQLLQDSTGEEDEFVID